MYVTHPRHRSLGPANASNGKLPKPLECDYCGKPLDEHDRAYDWDETTHEKGRLHFWCKQPSRVAFFEAHRAPARPPEISVVAFVPKRRSYRPIL